MANIPAFERGTVAGPYPALSNRQDEAYVEFIRDARNLLHNAQQSAIGDYSIALLEREGFALDSDQQSVDRAAERLLKDNAIRNYYRVKRTYQECFWQRIENSYGRRRDDLTAELDARADSGPGILKLNADLVIPDYAKSEIHLQPGGNNDDVLAGYLYDYGIMVFVGGAADNDFVMKAYANALVTPEDGKIERMLDLGCGPGALTSALKMRFPDAEIYGIDLSAPNLRYAHARAQKAELAVNFEQMSADSMAYEDNSFDIVTANLLFHELPVTVAKNVLAEVRRILRPGGIFHVFDFAGDKSKNAYSMFFIEMDAADNGEPYLTDFVRSNLEDKMTEAGFVLHDAFDPERIFSTDVPRSIPHKNH